MKTENSIVVSICCITFNHGDFIAQCIEGFLRQRTNFKFEILIHDDASNDNTQEIISQYSKKYPDMIFPILRDENVFSKGVRIINRFNFERARGKYVALCEGDDYWSNPNKLQEQVDFFDNNSDFVMSFHAVDVLQNESLESNYRYPLPRKTVLSFNDILFKHYIPTCSLMFRSNCLPSQFPKWVSKCVMGDLPLELMISHHGKVKYFPEKWGVYRKHNGGITHSRIQKKKGRNSLIIMYTEMRRTLGLKRFFPLTLMIIKTRLGLLKDLLS